MVINCKTRKQEYLKPAVFLDRDGVLVEERGYIASVRDLKLFPYTVECIRQIHRKGYHALVITNQNGIARGIFTEDELLNLNRYLIQQTGIDAIYYCSHHPEGKIEHYKRICRCRKPKMGLFEAACQDFEIELKNSYMVGDRASDIIAGQRMGLKTILLESGYWTARLENDVTPDFILRGLRDVIAIL